jgi:hypothetical protein
MIYNPPYKSLAEEAENILYWAVTNAFKGEELFSQMLLRTGTVFTAAAEFEEEEGLW